MAEYRTIKMSFWNDPYIEELEPKAKLLFLYLFTNSYTSNIGVLELTRRKIAFETGLTTQDVDKTLDAFERDGKVVCDKAHNLIMVVNFIKNQSSTSPKLLEGMRTLALGIPSAKIVRALAILYPQIYGVEPNGDTVSIPYANGNETLCIPSGEVGSRKLEVGSWKLEEEGGISADKSPLPPCPHKEIVSLFHETLPMLPQVKDWNDGRKAHLQSLWRYCCLERKEFETKAGGLEYFRKYFSVVRKSPFLMGQGPSKNGKEPFIATLPWLVKRENFAKVIEGNYTPRNQQPDWGISQQEDLDPVVAATRRNMQEAVRRVCAEQGAQEVVR